jgi:two-component system response regulator
VVSRAKTILLVEDNPDDVELTMRAFEKSRLASDVVVASDGEAALEYLFATGKHHGRDPQTDPTVVLLDLKLPKVSGLDVLRRMRQTEVTRRTPVVVLTSSNEERDIMSSYDLGANSFVRKPVDFTEFLEAARNLGVYWLVLNQPPVNVR